MLHGSSPSQAPDILVSGSLRAGFACGRVRTGDHDTAERLMIGSGTRYFRFAANILYESPVQWSVNGGDLAIPAGWVGREPGRFRALY